MPQLAAEAFAFKEHLSQLMSLKQVVSPQKGFRLQSFCKRWDTLNSMTVVSEIAAFPEAPGSSGITPTVPATSGDEIMAIVPGTTPRGHREEGDEYGSTARMG